MKLVTTTICALALALTATSARADIALSPSVGSCGDPLCLVVTGTNPSTAAINAFITSTYGVDELYKQNAGGGEEGEFAGDYTTTFNSSSDPSGGSIVWNGPGSGFINSNRVYVLVKDGNHTPAWYLFNISGWDGQEKITLSDFWPAGGSISHVSIYGTPDGGSVVMLLGGALVCLETLRRKFRA